MAQLTVHDTAGTTDLDPETDLLRRERLRSTIPVAVAVTLLFGLVVAGSLMLRSALDFGIWFLSSQ